MVLGVRKTRNMYKLCKTHPPSQDIEDQGGKMLACKQTKCVKGDFFFLFVIRLMGGLEQMVQHAARTNLYFITVRGVLNIHASSRRKERAKLLQEWKQIGHTWRRASTVTPSPRFQAFLSHLADSVLVCVHTIGVTLIWQEAEHSREMADPE